MVFLLNHIISELIQRRDAKMRARKEFIDRIEPKDFTEAREAEVDGMSAEIDMLNARIDELTQQDARVKRAAESAVQLGFRGLGHAGADHVYRPDGGKDSPSFFRDLITSQKGDWNAAERLDRNNRAVRESRALSTGAGAGGQFAPPMWAVDEFVALARAGRVTADLMHHETLPEGVSSINVPTIATGTAVAVQATQNTSVQNTDLTTSSVSSGITTIAGQQVTALQLLDQSPIPVDRAILADLAADYAVKLDAQVINGTGASGQLMGLLNTSGVIAQTYTDASPAFGGTGKYLSQVNQAIVAIATQRFLPPGAIIMHPRRWAWISSQVDSQNRPLVVPESGSESVNAFGDASSPVAQGRAGTLAGLPVYTDPNVPTNLGAGTNQDPTLIIRADDVWLYESNLAGASFDATYANQLSILFRVHAYSALVTRYVKAVAVINGTGVVTPTY